MLSLLALVLACDKSTPAPATPAAAEAGPSGPVAQASEPSEPETSPAQQEQAEAERKMAERIAKLEKDTAEKKARWTPELSAEVDELTSRTHRNLGAALSEILPSKVRAEGNAKRDGHRHPMKTLKFFGLTPKARVFEVGQGDGWYTELLAPLLAKEGKLYLAGYDAQAEDPGAALNARGAELFVEGGGPLYSEIELVTQSSEPNARANYGPENSLDVILVIRMLHNFHRANLWDQTMPAAFEALKPGGVLAVVQHRAPLGADPDETAPKGYLAEDFLIEKIESYGFELAAKSEVNANPKDTKDYDKGVWTLPPVLANGDADQQAYIEIGESDRATLKFVKPKQ